VSLIKSLNLVGWVERESSRTLIEKKHIKFTKKPEGRKKMSETQRFYAQHNDFVGFRHLLD
jgi:hypothetical protein